MTYEIHRYPADLIDVVYLRGERVVIRPILPQDEDLTTAFFGGLSAAARQQRFLSAMRSLPPGLVKRLTQVDYTEHLALVAEVFRDGRETVIAEARYARGADRSEAEFAVSVAEPWQGLGLARLLLGKLSERAALSGVRRLVGETLATNERMLNLARSAGFVITRSLEVRGVMHLEKTLASWPVQRSAAATPAAA
ncbi:MAG TPA: GNAT family N-acetyltransferase [Hyphomicrobiaceae bacterium]|jgi:acetyltransferase|nr:GNAT family N-acetyltransferase [Hyphomicrobiaceae bacterium]